MSKRILLVSNYSEKPGGINVQVDILFESLKKEGCDVSVASTYGTVLKRLWKCMKLFVIAQKYQIIHIHACSYWGFLPAVVGIMAAKLGRKKRIVITYHGGDAEQFFRSHIQFVRFFMKRVDVVIVLSGFLKKIFDNYDIPAIVIPNILRDNDQQKCKRGEIRPHYISVRHLRPMYNVVCILRAFRIVQQKMPEATLTILGDGDQRDVLEQYVSDNKLEGVRFLGNVDNAEVYSYLAENDILISAAIKDNLPMSILEAYAMGLLVIASDVGGVPYILSDGKNGYLFKSDDDRLLAEKMIKAVEEKRHSEEMVENARRELEKYSWCSIREQLFKVYQYE